MEIDAARKTTGIGSASTSGGLRRSDRLALAREGLATSLIIVAVISAVVLRWFHLGGQSLWFDEGQTESAAALSPRNIVRFLQTTDHPPLYFFLQHYWGVLFGNSEYALRSLSALFGTLSLPALYILAKQLFKDRMAVALAMWLFAFSPMQIWYSREARPYELASFAALVGLSALVLYLAKPSVGLFAAIVLSITASLYTHTMMFFYVLALNAMWLAHPSERTRIQRMKEVLLADIIAGILYLPWVPMLLTQVGLDVVHKHFWAHKPTIRILFGTMAFIAGFDTHYLSWLPGRLLPLSSGAARLLVDWGAGLLCVVVLSGALWRVGKADRNRAISLLLYGLLPIVVVFIISQITAPVFIDRVFIDSSLVIPILFAYPLALQKERKRRMSYGVVGLALAAATSLSAFGYLRYQQKDDWREAVGSLLSIPENKRLIIFVSRIGEPLFDYYAQRSPATDRSVTKMALPTSVVEEFPPPIGRPINATDMNRLKVAVQSGKYSEVDLVLSAELRDDPNEMVLNYLSQVFIHGEELRFTGIRIIRFMASPH